MAIDLSAPTDNGLSRRRCLLGAVGIALWPGARAAAPGARATLVAAWEADTQYHVGLISVVGDSWSIQQSITLPTRPHALLAEPGGTVLVVARRPGDWLLRWRPGTTQPQQHSQQWHWISGERRFNGHAIASAHHAQIWTTETDLDTAQGRLGVREARSLEKTDEWATHGMDPHELLALPERLGAYPVGTLMVANGGIRTLPETGRSKRRLDLMDASLVALNPKTGALLGQWRLADPFLSIRHLAWDASNQRLGIALQAEHPVAEDRWRAPVLAVWNGERIVTTPDVTDAFGSPDLRGYGGAVVANPGGGFLVGCPRANAVAVFDRQARWSHSVALPEACAVASSTKRWWAGGITGVLHAERGENEVPQLAVADMAPRWDNHWQVWPAEPTGNATI
jgi:hypothetical protein